MQHDPPTSGSDAAAKVDLWWRDNADRVRAYLHHHTDPATADDLLQEVFVLALRRHEVVPEPPIGWLFHTVRHVLANHRRSRARYARMIGRIAAVEAARPPVDAPAGDQAARHDLTALLDGLSDQDREVLTLAAWYQLTASEAAEALGISRNAYDVRLHRARARLTARHATDPTPEGGAR